MFVIYILFEFLDIPNKILPEFLSFNGMTLLPFHMSNLQEDVAPYVPKWDTT